MLPDILCPFQYMLLDSSKFVIFTNWELRKRFADFFAPKNIFKKTQLLQEQTGTSFEAPLLVDFF